MPRGKTPGVTASLRWTAIAAALLAPITGGVCSNPLRAQETQDAQTLAEQAIHRLDLQTELRREPEPLGFNFRLPAETTYLAVIVRVAVLLYAFRDMIPILRSGRGGAWGDDKAGTIESGQRAPEVVLGAADELAAQGRFVEAMHVLLLQALAEIRRRLD